MARTYRDIAIEDMLGTVQEAMSQAIDWWGDLPPPMKEAIEQFRTELGAAIDLKNLLERHWGDKYTKQITGAALPDFFCCGAWVRYWHKADMPCALQCPLSGVKRT